MAINRNELRFGNLVSWMEKGEPVIVEWSWGHWLGTHHKNYDFPDPVPITLELLQRLGFEVRNTPVLLHDIMWRHPDDNKKVAKLMHACNIYWHDGKFMSVEFTNDHGEYGTFPISHIKYIHQLQNLYNSLTGKELVLKRAVAKKV